MPPFWMAFALTLTETVGGGMLAIPIALAGVGVPVGLVLLGIFGLISITTVAALVEGITRDGTMRYGNGYFGQLVENRLGRPGGVAIGVSMFVLNAVGLLVALVGFGTVLAGQTGISSLIWVAILFAADRRRAAPREPGRHDRGRAAGWDRHPRACRGDDRSRDAPRSARAPGRRGRWVSRRGKRHVSRRAGLRRAALRLLRPHVRGQRRPPGTAARPVGTHAAVGQRRRDGRCRGHLLAVRDRGQRFGAGRSPRRRRPGRPSLRSPRSRGRWLASSDRSS